MPSIVRVTSARSGREVENSLAAAGASRVAGSARRSEEPEATDCLSIGRKVGGGLQGGREGERAEDREERRAMNRE